MPKNNSTVYSETTVVFTNVACCFTQVNLS